MDNKPIKTVIICLSLALVFFVAAIIASKVLLNGGTAYSLSSAPTLSGIVAQNLNLVGGNVSPPMAGTDFTLANVHYFDSNDWVVAQIIPLNSSTGNGYVVLELQNSIYQVVLGPGTAFDSTYQHSLPADVAQYIGNKGLFYEPIFQ